MKPNLERKKGEKIGVHITSHVCSEPGQLQLDGEPQQLLLSPRAWQHGQGRGERRSSWRRWPGWKSLAPSPTNGDQFQDQRSNFPLSDYINIVFIQVIEGLQNQRIPPATSAHLTVDPWELFQPELPELLGHTSKSTPSSAFQGETLIWGSALYQCSFHTAHKNFHYFFHLITPFVKPYWSWPTSFWNSFCGWQQRHRQHGNS